MPIAPEVIVVQFDCLAHLAQPICGNHEKQISVLHAAHRNFLKRRNRPRMVVELRLLLPEHASL